MGCRKNHLILEPYQTIIWVFRDSKEPMSFIKKVHEEVIHSEWTVGFARAEEYPEFQEVTKMDKLQLLSNLKDFERVSGIVSYSTGLTVNKANDIIETE